MSNNSFTEKRDAKQGGYKASGLKMNQKIAAKASWGLAELEERNAEMLALAVEIWDYPTTDFKPAKKEFDSCTLDDEDMELTGRDIVKYSYQNVEQPVSSWADMFEHIIKFLHHQDKSVLASLAYSSKGSTELAAYVSYNEDGLRSALKVDDNIYVEKNTSTTMKMSLLRRFFALYEADPMDLVFYLKDTEDKKDSDAARYDLRKRYWEYALPIIQKQHIRRGTFSGCTPTTSNTESGFFGLSGFFISCVANYDHARIDFNLSNNDVAKNKEAFDLLYTHKAEIEQKLGIELSWSRAEEYKASWISYHLRDVSLTNEADWPRMAKFHAEWSDKICGAMLVYLLGAETLRMIEIAGIFREWASKRSDTHINLVKCNRTYTRFTTDRLSAILPDIPNAPSGWNTDNHYFYELMNRTGKDAHIQLAISSHNIPDDFRAICDKLNQFYPAKMGKEDWAYRIPFRTKSFALADELKETEIYAALDECMEEIIAFEQDLAEKMK